MRAPARSRRRNGAPEPRPHPSHRRGDRVGAVPHLAARASPASTPTTSGSTRSASRASSGGVLGAKIALAVIFTGSSSSLLLGEPLDRRPHRPRFRPAGPEEEFIERYHELVGRRTGLVRIIVSLLFGLIAGVGCRASGTTGSCSPTASTSAEGPHFHNDIGFYVFQLPFLSFVVDWLFAACSSSSSSPPSPTT